jgi:hypothetical protein
MDGDAIEGEVPVAVDVGIEDAKNFLYITAL